MALVRGGEVTVKAVIDLLKNGLPTKLGVVEAVYTSSDPIVLPRPAANAYHYAMLRKIDLYPALVVKVPRVGYALRVGSSIMATKDRGGGQQLHVFYIHRHEDPEILAKIHYRTQRAMLQLFLENWSLGNAVMEMSVTAEETSVPLLGSNNVFHQVSRTSLLVQLEEGF